MKSLFLLLLLSLNLIATTIGDNAMKFAYFRDIKVLEPVLLLTGDAQRILSKKDLTDFASTTLRAKIGKPLNNLNLNGSKYKFNFQITLSGPYNKNLEIYTGYIYLTVEQEQFGRETYNYLYPIANHKDEINNTTKKTIENIIDYFVSDYYKIIDFDFTTLSQSDKLFFIFSFREDFDYFAIKDNLWNNIKNSQNELEKKHNNIILKLKEVKIGKSIARVLKDKNRTYFEIYSSICIDTNNDNIFDKRISKISHNIRAITDNDYYYEEFKNCPNYINDLYIKYENNK